MRWVHAVRTRLRLLFRRGSAESRMDEEFRFHVDMMAEANQRAGMSPAEARRRALVAFGGVERHKETMRDERGTRWLADASRDARHALRTLRRAPGFTAAAVLTLALGIGGTTAVFGLVQKVLLEPLPFREPDRLVSVGAGMGVLGEALMLRDGVEALERVESYTGAAPASLTGSGEPERLTAARVTPGLFPLLGVTPELGLAFVAVGAARRLLPPGFPRLAEVGIDLPVLGFALVTSLATSLLFGVVPALRATRRDPAAGLASSVRGGISGDRRRLSALVVAAEMAASVVLVIGAGLLLKSFSRLLDVDPGFRARNVVVASVAPPPFRFPEREDRTAFYDRLLERIRALPDVHAAAVGSGVPFGGDAFGSVFLIDGRPDPNTTGDWPYADIRLTVGPGYFRALGIPVLEGRAFTAADRPGAAGAAVVSRGLAEAYWPGREVVGKRLKLVWEQEWRTVVGVVDDARWSDLGGARSAALFVPMGQGPTGPMRVVIKAAGGTAAVTRALPDLVASEDEDTPVSDLGTLSALISDSLAQPRWAAALLSIFAALALALGAVGIYGVTSYAVTQRTREYAIRIALGAPRSRVLWRLLRWGAGLAAAGIVVGLVGAALATRLMDSMLFGVGPRDALTFITVPLFMGAVALAACWLPARRATRADPVAALRAE